MIPENVKSSILEKIDIVDIIDEYQSLKKKGSNYTGLCPFHNEKTPSFIVNPSKQFAKCFGCGEGVDVIGYLQKTQMLSFPEVMEILAKKANIELPKSQDNSEYEKLKALELAFEGLVNNNKSGEKYLVKRGFSIEVIKTFGVGFIGGGYKAKLNDLYHSNELLKKVGYINEKGNEFFFNRVMFPIHSSNGKLIAWSGRTRQNIQPKYINSPETFAFKKRNVLYNFHRAKSYIKKLGFVIVVEGYTDVMRLWQQGIRNVVAVCGTAFTTEQAKQIKHFTDNVTFIGDGDKAGKKAMVKSSFIAWDWKMNVTWLKLPEGEDPDSYFNGKTDLEINVILEKEGVEALSNLLEYKEGDSIAKVKAMEELCLQIDVIQDENIKTGIIKDLCKAHDLDLKSSLAYLKTKKVKNLEDSNNKVLNLNEELINRINEDGYVNIYDTKEGLINAISYDDELSCGFSKYIDDFNGIKRHVNYRFHTRDEGVFNEDPFQLDKTIVLALELLKNGNKISFYDDKYSSEYFYKPLPEYIALGISKKIEEAPDKREELFDLSVEILVDLPEKRRAFYIDLFVLALKIKKAVFNQRIKLSTQEKKNEVASLSFYEDGESFHEFDGKDIPDYVDPQFVNHYSFYPKQSDNTGNNICYMFKNQNGIFQRIGNFFIEPLFHVEDERGGEYNKRILRIRIMTKNEPEKIMEMPSGLMIDLKFFQKKLMEMGGAVFTGAQKHHWDYIIESTEQKYKRVREILTFGWQEHQKFFAFSNGAIYKGEFIESDELGLIEVNGKNYYSPASSSIYKGLPMESDKYQGIRYLHFDENSEEDNLNWNEWADAFSQVYQGNNNYMYAWLYIFVANNRKFIFNNRGYFTAPFFIGQTGSGKTQIAESIKNVFFKYQSPSFNLNQGTDAAFFSLLENYCDAPVVMEEYNDMQISDSKFQGLKSAILDGQGKAKRRSASTNEIDFSRIEAPMILLGQESPVRDDGALTNRSIQIEVFKKTAVERTQAEVNVFEKLKSAEKKGLSHILKRVVDTKKYIENEFPKTINELGKTMKKRLQNQNLSFDKRVFDIYMIFLAMAKVIDTNPDVYMPFKYMDAEKEILSALCEQSNMINDNNRLSNFFSHIEFYNNNDKYTFGKEFKVAKKSRITYKISGGKTNTEVFKEPIDIFYVKLKDVYPGYQDQYKKEALNMANLKTYLRNHKAFVGDIKSERFTWMSEEVVERGENEFVKEYTKRTVQSSCFAFRHDMLDENFILSENDQLNTEDKASVAYKREMKNDKVQEHTPNLFPKDDNLPF